MISKNILLRKGRLLNKFSSHCEERLICNMYANLSSSHVKFVTTSMSNLANNKLFYYQRILKYNQFGYRLFSTRHSCFGYKKGYDVTKNFGYIDEKDIDLKPSLKARNVIQLPAEHFEKFQNANVKINKKEQYHSVQKENISRNKNRYNHGLSGKGTYEHKMSKQAKVQGVTGEIIYGLYPVLYALQQKVRICHRLFMKEQKLSSVENDPDCRSTINEIVQAADINGIDIIPCKAKQLTILSGDRPHQGVCLDASPREYDKFETSFLQNEVPEENKGKLWLYLESVKDTMNFGAILRSSYYLGVEKILCSSENSCGLTPVVSKASSGVLELMTIYSVPDLTSLVQNLKLNGWSILGTTPHNEKDVKVKSLHNVRLTQPTLLLLGNEGHGLTSSALDLCDTLVTIKPRLDLDRQVESLNVSVATGIILHHLLGRDD